MNLKKVDGPSFVDNLVSDQSELKKEVFSHWMSTHLQRRFYSLSSKLFKKCKEDPLSKLSCVFSPQRIHSNPRGFPYPKRKHQRHPKKSEMHLPQCPCIFTTEKEVVNEFLIRLTKIASIC